MYGKFISTQFFYQLRFFYQLLNYNNLDYNQIKIFIKLEIIGEEDKKKKIISIFKKNLKKFMQFGKTTWRNHNY